MFFTISRRNRTTKKKGKWPFPSYAGFIDDWFFCTAALILRLL